MKKITWFLLILVLAAAVFWFWPRPVAAPADENAQLANPASVFCAKNGGQLEIRTGSAGGQVGYCRFTDGSECEEWAYYRAVCGPSGPKD